MFFFVRIYINERIKWRLQSCLNAPAESAECSNSKGAYIMDSDKKFLDILKSSYATRHFWGKNTAFKKNEKRRIKMIEANLRFLYLYPRKSYNDILVLALTNFNMGIFYTEYREKEKLRTAQNYFIKCIIYSNSIGIDARTILIVMKAYIQLDLIGIRLNIRSESSRYVNRAMTTYLRYTQDEDEYPDPIDVTTSLGFEKEFNPKIHLDECFLFILERFEYLHMHSIKIHSFINYVCKLLNKQLMSIDKKKLSFYWLNATIELSMYFIENRYLYHTRHLLAAATFVLKNPRMYILSSDCNENEKSEVFTKSEFYFAHINKQWGAHGVMLLHISKQLYFMIKEARNRKNTQKEMPLSKEEGITVSSVKDLEELYRETVWEEKNKSEFEEELPKHIFPTMTEHLNNILATTHMAQMPVYNVSDAKWLFKASMIYFESAKKYFKYNVNSLNNLSLYCEIILNIAELYKCLANFEIDIDEQIILHEQRIKLLEELVKERPLENCKDTKIIYDMKQYIKPTLYTRINIELALSNTFLLEKMIENAYLLKSNKINFENFSDMYNIKKVVKTSMYYVDLVNHNHKLGF